VWSDATVLPYRWTIGKWLSSSAFALYSVCFAYYCSFYFAPFRPSNSGYGILRKGKSPQKVTHLPVCILLIYLAVILHVHLRINSIYNPIKT
jgi:hypothetical protein